MGVREGLLDRGLATGKDAEGLVADLVPVAVRAVEQVAAPPVGDTGNVRGKVAQTSGHQDPSGGQGAPAAQGDVEAAAAQPARLASGDVGDGVCDQLDAV